MRILITGGAGFIGSNLARTLAPEHEIVVLDSFADDYSPDVKHQNLSGLDIEVVQGDIRDLGLVDRLIKKGTDAVVHLAARAGVRQSIAQPSEYASTNVAGTAGILEVLSRHPSVPLVFASSSSVYGSRSGGPFRETDRVDQPESPYAATKRAAELLCYAAHQNTGLSVTCLRFFTVFGPRQRPGMAIAKFVRQVQNDEEVTVYGDGSSVRDYTFVTDAVAAIQKSLMRGDGFNVINIGCGNPVSLENLVRAIGAVTGRKVNVKTLPPQDGDVPLTHADISRAGDLLDWRPEVSLEEGLSRYLQWLSSVDASPVTKDRRSSIRSTV